MLGLSAILASSLPGRTLTPSRCLILGAGIAGIAAAQALKSSGISATILEARDRVGGRAWTDHSLGFPVDLGAAWIEGTENNPMVPLAAQLGARTRSDDGAYRYWSGRRQPLELDKEMDWLNRQLQQLRSRLTGDISYAEAVERILGGRSPQLAAAFLDDLECTWALDANQLSFLHGQDEDGYEGEERILCDGYGTLAQAMASGLDVRLGHKVLQIHQDRDQVRVVTSKATFEAQRAIVTLPLGVLQSQDVQFSPPLSAAKRQAFRYLKMGVLDKVVLRFERIYWPDQANFNFLSSPRARLPLVVNWHHFSGHPALVCFSAGSQAVRRESMDQAAIVDEVMAQLKLMLGRPLPDPTGVVVTRWNQDPCARGSYSGLLVGCSGNERAILARPEGLLSFAGEATSVDQPACVPGALLSGRRAAAEVIEALAD